MGRFANLEFEGEKKLPDSPQVEPPLDDRHWLAQAQERFREGRFDAALRSYSRALETPKPLAEAWLGQVLALVELDEPEEARVWADKGLESFPGHPELTAAKAVAAARLGEGAAGLALSDEALAVPGTTGWRWRARGEVLLAGNDRNAEFCFGKAIAAAPQESGEPLAIARAYLRWGRPAPALRWAETAISRRASDPFAWETLGRCREELGLAAEGGEA